MISLIAPARQRARWPVFALIGVGLALAAYAHQSTSRAPIVFNDSASVPIGFWVRHPFNPRDIHIGSVIGFRPNRLAMRYVRPFMPEYVKRMTIQKYVAGIPGDIMCRHGRAFSINGEVLGIAATHDGEGNPLPSWHGCQTLRRGQYAVFSDRISNSFDSRYYGAVSVHDIRGIYEPVMTW